jgi:hypothetical protein
MQGHKCTTEQTKPLHNDPTDITQHTASSYDTETGASDASREGWCCQHDLPVTSRIPLSRSQADTAQLAMLLTTAGAGTRQTQCERHLHKVAVRCLFCSCSIYKECQLGKHTWSETSLATHLLQSGYNASLSPTSCTCEAICSHRHANSMTCGTGSANITPHLFQHGAYRARCTDDRCAACTRLCNFRPCMLAASLLHKQQSWKKGHGQYSDPIHAQQCCCTMLPITRLTTIL